MLPFGNENMDTNRETVDETGTVDPQKKLHEEPEDGILYLCVNCFSRFQYKNQFVNHVRICGRTTTDLYVAKTRQNPHTHEEITRCTEPVARNDTTGRKDAHPSVNQSDSSKNRQLPGLHLSRESIKVEDIIVSPAEEDNGNSTHYDVIVRDNICGLSSASSKRIKSDLATCANNRGLQIKREMIKKEDNSFGADRKESNTLVLDDTDNTYELISESESNTTTDANNRMPQIKREVINEEDGSCDADRKENINFVQTDTGNTVTKSCGFSTASESSTTTDAINRAPQIQQGLINEEDYSCDADRKEIIKLVQNNTDNTCGLRSAGESNTTTGSNKFNNSVPHINRKHLNEDDNSCDADGKYTFNIVQNDTDNICELSSASETNTTTDANNRELHMNREMTNGEAVSFDADRKENNTSDQNDTDNTFGHSSENESRTTTEANNRAPQIKRELINEDDTTIDADSKANNNFVQNDTGNTCELSAASESNTNTDANKFNNRAPQIMREVINEEDDSCDADRKENIHFVQTDTGNTITKYCGLSTASKGNTTTGAINRAHQIMREVINEEDTTIDADSKEKNIFVQNDTDNTCELSSASESNTTTDTNKFNNSASQLMRELINEEDTTFNADRTAKNVFVQNDTGNTRGQSSANDCDRIISNKASDANEEKATCTTGTESRTHECNICHVRVENLKRHIRIHSGEKRFECRTCNKTFPYKYSLRRHESTGVCLNKERKYECNICGVRVKKLKNHMIIHSDEKRFKCDSCHKKFRTWGSLRKHQSNGVCGLSSASESNRTTDTNNRVPQIMREVINEEDTTFGADRKENNTSVQNDTDNTCGRSLSNKCDRINSNKTSDANEEKATCTTSTLNRKHECHICHVMVKNLKLHIKIHSGEKRFECGTCHKKYTSKYNLKRHESTRKCLNKSKPARDRKYECTICHIQVKRLKRHMKNHSSDKKRFECDTCRRKFKERRSLRKHQSKGVCLNYGKTVMVDESSSESELDKESLMSAENIPGCYMEHYTMVDTGFDCNHCHKAFDGRNGIAHHIKAQLDKMKQRKDSYLCKLCYTEFDMKCKLAYHRVMKHEGNKAKCTVKKKTGDECGKLFSRYKKLRAHILSRHKKERFLCDICGQTWKTKYILKRHKLSHITHRSFKCGNCDKAFVSQERLTCHEKFVHSVDLNYMCEFCPKKFTRKEYLQIHSRIHTKEKPYKCSKCDMKFGQYGSMIRHEVTHTMAKKFACKLCEKSFTQSQSLTRHMISHTGKTPYRCEPCDLDFREGYRLKLHREKAHSLVSQS